MPDYFYSSIPNIQDLKNSNTWRKPYSLSAINGTDLDRQLGFVEICCTVKNQEILKTKDIHLLSCQENEYGFGKMEAEFLYCFMTTFKPKKVAVVKLI